MIASEPSVHFSNSDTQIISNTQTAQAWQSQENPQRDQSIIQNDQVCFLVYKYFSIVLGLDAQKKSIVTVYEIGVRNSIQQWPLSFSFMHGNLENQKIYLELPELDEQLHALNFIQR